MRFVQRIMQSLRPSNSSSLETNLVLAIELVCVCVCGIGIVYLVRAPSVIIRSFISGPKVIDSEST